jgi:hypothetical protein
MLKAFGGMTQLVLRDREPEVVIVPPLRPLPAVIAVTVPVPNPVAEIVSKLPEGVRAILLPAARLVQTVTLPVEDDRAMPTPAVSAVIAPPPPPVTVIVPFALTVSPDVGVTSAG